ncbi:MAG: glycoside hydrolase family 2 protein [Clostridia bacterium]|nr:glycoside hydrolase family 2 protein [Clostridia bacterium]
MKKTNLGGAWRMKRTDWESDIAATVPGSICTDMMHANLLPDPYYKDNSKLFEEAAKYDYIYSREFYIEEGDISFINIELCCDGLDTLCDIFINGEKLASANNMHRLWRFNIKDIIHTGRNEISVLIKSPLEYCRENQERRPLSQVSEEQCRAGFAYLRKAHCMLGWDWGAVIPDGGIWKDIYISYDNGLRIKSVFVTQEHTSDGRVFLNVISDIKNECGTAKYIIEFNGKKYESYEANMRIEVENPILWYPAGYGRQHLYDFSFTAISEHEQDTYSCHIGLRRAEVVTDNDKYGTSMYFRINGIPIFSKGANYIIEDNIITRYSEERTRTLLTQAFEANHNTVRVWGGAIYPHDYFYEICDELGLIVWQDLMFACAQYPDSPEFYSNIKHEAEDNIKRLRNHASLIMWCGNNECELAVKEWWSLSDKERNDYLYQYNVLLRNVVSECDPSRYYLPSSPTSTGNFENINDDSVLDSHYWEIWFSQKPLNEYMKYHFRFLSEFGFQSFPCIETTETFTEAEDRNIFSRVMEHHQRSEEANGKILLYLARDFKYPKDFDSLLYVSQILQAEAVRAGVEHMRRNRNDFRCMGAIYWQLNDCWPVASWSGLDYFGRWKALHYSSKRFFADILLSALHYDKNKALISLTNDTTKPVSKKVYYSVKERDGREISRKETNITVEALSSKNVYDIETGGIDPYSQYIEYGMDGEMTGIILLCHNKHFDYDDPEISYTTENHGGKTIIRIVSRSLANFVELKADNNTVKFSDNYFALSAGVEKEVICSKAITELSIRSVHDTYNISR